MTHLTPYRPAAVALCELHGVDPDTDVPVQHPLLAGATVNRKAWELRAEALIDLSQMLLALRIGAASQGEAQPTH
jgi:hypothetical protein